MSKIIEVITLMSSDESSSDECSRKKLEVSKQTNNAKVSETSSAGLKIKKEKGLNCKDNDVIILSPSNTVATSSLTSSNKFERKSFSDKNDADKLSHTARKSFSSNHSAQNVSSQSNKNVSKTSVTSSCNNHILKNVMKKDNSKFVEIRNYNNEQLNGCREFSDSQSKVTDKKELKGNYDNCNEHIQSLKDKLEKKGTSIKSVNSSVSDSFKTHNVPGSPLTVNGKKVSVTTHKDEQQNQNKVKKDITQSKKTITSSNNVDVIAGKSTLKNSINSHVNKKYIGLNQPNNNFEQTKLEISKSLDNSPVIILDKSKKQKFHLKNDSSFKLVPTVDIDKHSQQARQSQPKDVFLQSKIDSNSLLKKCTDKDRIKNLEKCKQLKETPVKRLTPLVNLDSAGKEINPQNYSIDNKCKRKKSSKDY